MDRVGHWLQIFANLGLLVGLVFVGLQMRQDHQLASVQLQADAWNSVNETALAAVGESLAASYAKLAVNPESLDAEDIAVLSFWFRSLFITMERLALLEAHGLIDESWRDEYLPGIAAELGGNPVTREWVLELQLEEDWVSSLQAIAAEVEPTLIQETLRSRLDRARALSAGQDER